MNRLIQKLVGKSIAIVGNGNVRENYSKEIDSADIVLRFNNFYNYGSNKVGKRVDIVAQTITKAYFDSPIKHIDVMDKYRPEVFLVRSDSPYLTNIHKFYGNAIRVNNTTRWFEADKRFTTGTTVLHYLADNLTNAKVKCYGFQDEDDWQRYISTDAKCFKNNGERAVMLETIKKLEGLEITDTAQRYDVLPRIIVIPVKATSVGCPHKNDELIDNCIKEAIKTNIKICVVGDDYDLLHKVQANYQIDTYALPMIAPFADVTDTLRDWKVKSGYCGDVAMVQCTSPYIKAGWITQCLDALKHSAISATATTLKFKPTAIYEMHDNVFVKSAVNLPAPSVARQLLPQAVRITGAVVAFHTDALDNKSFYDDGVMHPIIVSESDSLDIDTKEDLLSWKSKENQNG